ncbi:MAG: hypothetical protein HC875_39725 [Anaerolineales bacterium]|nr:hypothetical protein [Anaerolineales bacterium]
MSIAAQTGLKSALQIVCLITRSLETILRPLRAIGEAVTHPGKEIASACGLAMTVF